MNLIGPPGDHNYPEPHAKYLVRREDLFFTATPCYGLHQPWWVVTVMRRRWFSGPLCEDEPVEMEPEDQWMPLREVSLEH